MIHVSVFVQGCFTCVIKYSVILWWFKQPKDRDPYSL